MVDARRDGAWRFMEVGSCCACSIGGGSALGWRVPIEIKSDGIERISLFGYILLK